MQRRPPPGEARLGPGPYVCGRHGLHATRLVPSSGGEGATPLPAGQGPARAGPPRVWVPLPSRCLVGAKQRRGERNAAPHRAEPGSGRGPTCVGATAFMLLDWSRAAEERARRLSPPGRAWVGPGPPRVWVPLPSRFLVGAKQRRGERNAAPRRAEPGSGRGPTCVGAMAFMPLGWCRAAEGRVQHSSPPG